MNTPHQASTRGRLRWLATVSAIALVFALVVTACGWLWVGKDSPVNHGVVADVSRNPSVTIWVLLTLPAACLFLGVFGAQRAEWQYFLCVFVQWYAIGWGLGAAIMAIRRASRDGRK